MALTYLTQKNFSKKFKRVKVNTILLVKNQI